MRKNRTREERRLRAVTLLRAAVLLWVATLLLCLLAPGCLACETAGCTTAEQVNSFTALGAATAAYLITRALLWLDKPRTGRRKRT